MGTSGDDVGHGVAAGSSAVYVTGNMNSSNIFLMKYIYQPTQITTNTTYLPTVFPTISPAVAPTVGSDVLAWTRETGSIDYDEGNSVSVTADGSSIYVTGSSGASLNGQPYTGGMLTFILFIA
jgi:hypothetical protein